MQLGNLKTQYVTIINTTKMENKTLNIDIEEQSQSRENDVFSDFSLPSLIKPMIREKVSGFFKRFCDVIMFGGFANKLDISKLEVIIPPQFQEALKNGFYNLGNKANGMGFTPNIYDQNGKLVGQAFIRENVNPVAVGDFLTNIAAYGMLQQISGQIEEVKENQRIMLEGQRTDRLGYIIGSYRAYLVAYPTFQSETERRIASFNVYNAMSQGIHQIHFELDTLAKDLKEAPDTAWDHFLQAVSHPFTNVAEKKETAYNYLVYGMYKYYNMLKLSDIILLERGADEQVIANNHKGIEAFCLRVFDENMDAKVKYLTGGETKDYLDIQNNIFSYIDNIKEILLPSFKEAFKLNIKIPTNKLIELSRNGRQKEN